MSVKPFNLSLQGFDFVDFGCSSGGSIAFARDRLGGVNGLGLDIDAGKVSAARNKGLQAHVADVTKIDPSYAGKVRFVIMSHFLEHLVGLQQAEHCIRSACLLSREFVFIRQPFFDADGLLFRKRLKLYWSDWTGHTNKMTSLDFYSILTALLASAKIKRFLIFFRYKIKTSQDDAIHDIGSPRDSHEWREGTDSEKTIVSFKFPIFREIGAIILTSNTHINAEIEKYLRNSKVLIDQS